MALDIKNKNMVLNIVILVIACFIAFNFIYKGQESSFKNLMAQKEAEQNKNAVLESIGKIEKRIADYKVLLPARDPSETMNTINSLARDAGLKITSFKPPVTEEKEQGYIKIVFEIAIGAPNYHALGRFVSSLENNQDVFIVESVDIASQEPGKELTANLRVSSIAVAQ